MPVTFVSKSNILYKDGVSVGDHFHLETNTDGTYYAIVNETTGKRKKISKIFFHSLLESLEVVADKIESPQYTRKDLISLLDYYEKADFTLETNLEEIVDGFLSNRNIQRALS